MGCHYLEFYSLITGGEEYTSSAGYSQVLLVLVDVVQLQDVRVLDQLQDGNLSFHLSERRDGGEKGGREKCREREGVRQGEEESRK